MDFKIGLSLSELQWKFGLREAIEIATSAGADAADIDLGGNDYRDCNNIYAKSDHEIEDYYHGIKEYARSLGIELCQTHGRLRTGFKEKEETAAALENARRDLLATSALGVDVSAFHYINSFRMGIDTPPDIMRSTNFDVFMQIFDYAHTYGVKVAAETFGNLMPEDVVDFFGNINEFIDVYDRIAETDNNKKLACVCMDVGHTNTAVRYGNPSVGSVIRMLGKRIEILHLHDNDGISDQHKLPFSGTIDWNDIFDALDEIGFNGVYNIEASFECLGKGIERETAAFAVTSMRNFLNNRYN